MANLNGNYIESDFGTATAEFEEEDNFLEFDDDDESTTEFDEDDESFTAEFDDDDESIAEFDDDDDSMSEFDDDDDAADAEFLSMFLPSPKSIIKGVGRLFSGRRRPKRPRIFRPRQVAGRIPHLTNLRGVLKTASGRSAAIRVPMRGINRRFSSVNRQLRKLSANDRRLFKGIASLRRSLRSSNIRNRKAFSRLTKSTAAVSKGMRALQKDYIKLKKRVSSQNGMQSMLPLLLLQNDNPQIDELTITDGVTTNTVDVTNTTYEDGGNDNTLLLLALSGGFGGSSGGNMMNNPLMLLLLLGGLD